MKYFLIDANLTAGYYLPTSLDKNDKVKKRIKSILDYAKKIKVSISFIFQIFVLQKFSMFFINLLMEQNGIQN